VGKYNTKTESRHFTGHRGKKCITCRFCADLVGYKEDEEEEIEA